MSERLLTGACPKCQKYIEVYTFENRWPLVVCDCGWKGGVVDVKGGVVK